MSSYDWKLAILYEKIYFRLLLAHQKDKKHKVQDTNSFFCAICDYKLQSRTQLYYHVATKHPNHQIPKSKN